MNVPMLDLKAQYATIRAEVHQASDEVFETQQFVLGPKVSELERAIAAYAGTSEAVGVSSGSDALLMALMVLGAGAEDRVITTSYSFYATAGAILRLGAIPVFTDIDPATYNLSPEALSKTWEGLSRPHQERVRAILPVHLFGQCADMLPILKLAQKSGVPVVEDAAQAIGAEHGDGRRAGSIGVMGCFSFFPSKNLGGIGDGGMVVTSDPAVADQLRLLRVHGAKTEYHHQVIGGNFRLDALNAAILLVKLKHLDGWTRARRERAEIYHRLFEDSGLVAQGRVSLPAALYHTDGRSTRHVFHQYVIRAESRASLRSFLAKAGVETRVYYPVPFHLQECFRSLGYREGDFPEAERASRETLSLPIYPELTMEQQAYVVEQTRNFYRAVG